MFSCLFTLLVLLCLFHSTHAVGPPYWLTDCPTHNFLLAWVPSDRPHVMSQPRLRSPSHMAPHQLISSAASSPKDHSPTASGSAVSPSKFSPHMTPLPPLTCSRSPPPPSSLITSSSCTLYYAPAPVKWAPELWTFDPSTPDMANCQEKEVDPFDAKHVPAGSFVPFYLSEPV